LSCGFPLHKQHSNHSHNFSAKKKKYGNEIQHQYPIYPFPEVWMSGSSGWDFAGKFIVSIADAERQVSLFKPKNIGFFRIFAKILI